MIVTSPERRADVRRLVEGLATEIDWAVDCAEARSALRRVPPKVVITDLTLPDGNWWCVYHDLAEAGLDAECIVLAPEAGIEKAPMFETGAFAVLEPPWKAEELRRAVVAAGDAQRRHAVVGEP